MIYKEGRMYNLQCDFCSNYVDDFETFDDAVDWKKVEGWKSVYLGDGCWEDKCPDCIEKEAENGEE